MCLMRNWYEIITLTVTLFTQWVNGITTHVLKLLVVQTYSGAKKCITTINTQVKSVGKCFRRERERETAVCAMCSHATTAVVMGYFCQYMFPECLPHLAADGNSMRKMQ